MGDDLAAVFAFVLMAGFAAYAKRYAVAGVFVLVVDSVAGHGAAADACLLEAHKHYVAGHCAVADAYLLEAHKHSVCHALHPQGCAVDRVLIY